MKIFLIFFLIFFFSCVTPLNFEPEIGRNYITVNSVFTESSIFKINLSKASSILSQEYESILNAEVYISTDTSEEKLSEVADGQYISNSLVKLSENYALKIVLDNNDTIQAHSSVPEKPNIDSAYIKKVDELDGEISWEINFNLIDKGDTKNYYEMVFVSTYYDEVQDSTQISFLSFPKNPDIVIQNESKLELKPKSFVFSDTYFNGQKYKMKMLMVNGTWYGGKIAGKFQNDTVGKRYLIMRSLSKEYFDVANSWISHKYFQATDDKTDDKITLIFSGEPQNLYSNITGGLGIFAGYQELIYELKEQ
jgi:Domain of unknown function (DUF4249)